MCWGLLWAAGLGRQGGGAERGRGVPGSCVPDVCCCLLLTLPLPLVPACPVCGCADPWFAMFPLPNPNPPLACAAQIRTIRKKMVEIMAREASSCDLKELVAKFIPEAIGKDIEKACQVGGGASVASLLVRLLAVRRQGLYCITVCWFGGARASFHGGIPISSLAVVVVGAAMIATATTTTAHA